MAKLFEQKKEFPKAKRLSGLIFALVIAILVSISLIFVVIEGKKERESNKNKSEMKLVKLLEMKNGYILTRMVRYKTSEKVDPKDTSDVFFEVVNGNENFEEGDLVKFNHNFFKETSIENEVYCSMDATQVEYRLKKEYVKENLLKRQ